MIIRKEGGVVNVDQLFQRRQAQQLLPEKHKIQQSQQQQQQQHLRSQGQYQQQLNRNRVPNNCINPGGLKPRLPGAHSKQVNDKVSSNDIKQQKSLPKNLTRSSAVHPTRSSGTWILRVF